MKTLLHFLIILNLFAQTSFGQISDSLTVPESNILDLDFLIVEAMQNNPDIRAASFEWDMFRAKIPQSNSPASPELSVMQEDMPGFDPGDAMFTRVELMQMFHYPGKLQLMGELAHIQSEHSHHDHLEK